MLSGMAPIHEGDLVELTLQTYADEAGAAAFAAALRSALAEALTSLGRWQIGDPALASEMAASMDAEYRAEPPPVGTRLWEVRVGARGEGDIDDFNTRVLDLLHSAGIPFEQFGLMVHGAGTKYFDDALTRYPALDLPVSP